MPLINCKAFLELNWTKNCVMSNIAGDSIYNNNHKIACSNCYLSSKDNVKLIKKLNEVFETLFVRDFNNPIVDVVNYN